jgi:DNA polymerase-3 subunit epsilon
MNDDNKLPASSGVIRGAFLMSVPATPYTLTLEVSELNDRALIIDTETTGRGMTAEIIEVALATLDGEPLFTSLVRPMSEVPRSAARIHGLMTEDLVGAPVWDEVWKQLESLLKGRLLIAYNAAFDRRMVEVMCAYYRLPRPDYLQWRCAMRFVRERGGWRRAPTLSEACHRYGIAPGTHRALTDAQATALLLQRIINK